MSLSTSTSIPQRWMLGPSICVLECTEIFLCLILTLTHTQEVQIKGCRIILLSLIKGIFFYLRADILIFMPMCYSILPLNSALTLRKSAHLQIQSASSQNCVSALIFTAACTNILLSIFELFSFPYFSFLLLLLVPFFYFL